MPIAQTGDHTLRYDVELTYIVKQQLKGWTNEFCMQLSPPSQWRLVMLTVRVELAIATYIPSSKAQSKYEVVCRAYQGNSVDMCSRTPLPCCSCSPADLCPSTLASPDAASKHPSTPTYQGESPSPLPTPHHDPKAAVHFHSTQHNRSCRLPTCLPPSSHTALAAGHNGQRAGSRARSAHIRAAAAVGGLRLA